MTLAFTIIHPINISLHNISTVLNCRFQLITSSNIYIIYIIYYIIYNILYTLYIKNILYIYININIYIYIYNIYIYIYINFVCLYLKMSNHNLFKKTFFYLKLTNYFEIAPISFIVEHCISILCLQIYLKHIPTRLMEPRIFFTKRTVNTILK